jgi:hypothetical protein
MTVFCAVMLAAATFLFVLTGRGDDFVYALFYARRVAAHLAYRPDWTAADFVFGAAVFVASPFTIGGL